MDLDQGNPATTKSADFLNSTNLQFGGAHTTSYVRRVGLPIVAPATALGGPLVVIRVSGADLCARVGELFQGSFPKNREATLTAWRDPASNTVLDKGLSLFFAAPHSFTGEDVLELHCHGAPSIVTALLECLASLGVARALPGEFMFRAVFFNKLSLAQAEAMNFALTIGTLPQEEASALLSLGRHAASMEKSLGRTLDQLRTARGRLEAAVDFPELELEQEEEERAVKSLLQPLSEDLRRLVESWDCAVSSSEVPVVALVGKPNAGKSSLFNLLLGRDAAIVSADAGTTRDVVEALWRLPSGRRVRLVDMAGIRENPANEVEAEGIRRAKDWASRASVHVVVSDSRDALQPSFVFSDTERGKKDCARFLFRTHGDLSGAAGAVDLLSAESSAKAVQELVAFVERWMDQRSDSKELFRSAGEVTSSWQRLCLEEALQNVLLSLELLDSRGPYEIVGDALYRAEISILSARDDRPGEEYIDKIFSQFCLGK